MPLQLGKLALPGDDITWLASVVMTNEDSAYPATNLLNGDPADVAKSTTTSTTITFTTASKTIVAAALINTNATTATVNGNTVTIPALTPDGQRVHGWLDLSLAPITGTSWTIALSVASGEVWIGRIPLVVTLRDVNWPWEPEFPIERPGVTVIRSRLGSVMVHDSDIRMRHAEATFDLEEDLAMWRALEQSAKGVVLPFLLIWDVTVNDAKWVRMPKPFSHRPRMSGYTDVPMLFEELSGGPPNG